MKVSQALACAAFLILAVTSLAVGCDATASGARGAICRDRAAGVAEAMLSLSYKAAVSAVANAEARKAVAGSGGRWLRARDAFFATDEGRDLTMRQTALITIGAAMDRMSMFPVDDPGLPGRLLERQAATMAPYMSGGYAGFDIRCELTRTPLSGEPIYLCGGSLTLQNGRQICREEIVVTPLRRTEYRSVGRDENGSARIVSRCLVDVENACRDFGEGVADEPGPVVPDAGGSLKTGLPKLDLDAGYVAPPEWMLKCLGEPAYAAEGERKG